MHESMAQSPFVQENITRLNNLGHVFFLEPRREENKLKSPSPRLIALEISHRINSMKSFSGRSPTAAITFGGTRVNIDPVRCVTNLSSGALGLQLAESLYAAGVQLVLLRCQTQLSSTCEPDVTPFFQNAQTLDVPQYKQLKEALAGLTERNTSAIFHLAAISDYAPVEQAAHKLSSKNEELVIRLQKTQKLLQLENLRNIRFQMACKLTNFGDSSDATEETRGLKVARDFCETNRLNLCLWNAAGQSIGCSSHAHKATLLVPPWANQQELWMETKSQGKLLIAGNITKAFLASFATTPNEH